MKINITKEQYYMILGALRTASLKADERGMGEHANALLDLYDSLLMKKEE